MIPFLFETLVLLEDNILLLKLVIFSFSHPQNVLSLVQVTKFLQNLFHVLTCFKIGNKCHVIFNILKNKQDRV